PRPSSARRSPQPPAHSAWPCRLSPRGQTSPARGPPWVVPLPGPCPSGSGSTSRSWLAGVAIWQLRLYGAPLVRDVRGSLGLDPLLVAAPAIGLLGGGVIATRAVPRVAEIAQLVLERRRDLVASLGARQLARRPLRYTRSALLLMLAAGLGTFAAVDAATWSA